MVSENSEHKIIFQMTPELEKKRALSLEPAKKDEIIGNKTGNLLDSSFKKGNEGNILLGSQRKDEKNRKINATDNSFLTFFRILSCFSQNNLRNDQQDRDFQVSKGQNHGGYP